MIGANEEWVGGQNDVPGHLPLRRKGKDKMPVEVPKQSTIGNKANNRARDYLPYH
jgi:hypothetical protein